ncbi:MULTISPECIES: H-NS histone family protein [unclassified Bradyrhizobium]|uniref:H-NS histone family protein n=1 Tax=unclassified Bradyrhizobium TaxID=2631580 RepID=UPI003391A8D1
MNTEHFNSLSLDELWMLHQQVAATLSQKILVQKARLEERLRKIGLAEKAVRFDRKRRPYPPVRPKYSNPNNPAETWSGRGRLPRWLRPQLRGGREVGRFLNRPRFGSKAADKLSAAITLGRRPTAMITTDIQDQAIAAKMTG